MHDNTTIKTFDYQRKFADYCRTGEYNTIPGVDEKNIKHYRRLVYNVFEDSLRSAYPLTYKLITEDEWFGLVDEFMVKHNASDPQVWKMPKEFYEYIVSTNHEITQKYPQLSDLLKFEWYEIEIYMQEDIGIASQINGIKINPNNILLELNYPVHNTPASNITEDHKGLYFVVLYRRTDNFKVIFTDLASGTASVVQILNHNSYTLDDVYQLLTEELNIQLDDSAVEGIKSFVDWGFENQLFFR